MSTSSKKPKRQKFCGLPFRVVTNSNLQHQRAVLHYVDRPQPPCPPLLYLLSAVTSLQPIRYLFFPHPLCHTLYATLSPFYLFSPPPHCHPSSAIPFLHPLPNPYLISPLYLLSATPSLQSHLHLHLLTLPPLYFLSPAPSRATYANGSSSCPSICLAVAHFSVSGSVWLVT